MSVPPETVEIAVDEELCAASAMCKRIAPEVFDLPDDADTAIVKQPTVSDPAQIERVEEAVASCPTLAISADRKQ